ncbi:hypothetical protein AC1031_012027 [Aphanomyces cochlioides]|nr:hypothetical protein AC1031_012027 [Aphanomyces cochlioides]
MMQWTKALRTMSTAAMEEMKREKKALRKAIERELKQLASDEIDSASARLASHVLASPEFIQAKSICAYLSMPKEASTSVIVDAILAQDMVMLQVESRQDLVSFPKSKWDIPEPELILPNGIPRLNAMETLDLDLILVPGVAFDRRGNRLGHGKGYYDSFFERYAAKTSDGKLPWTVGISLDFQVIDHVPTLPHDRRLDAVVTPDSMLIVNPSSHT